MSMGASIVTYPAGSVGSRRRQLWPAGNNSPYSPTTHCGSHWLGACRRGGLVAPYHSCHGLTSATG